MIQYGFDFNKLVMLPITIKSMDPKTNFKRGSYFVLICVSFESSIVPEARQGVVFVQVLLI